MNLLVGCPVSDRAWILPYWLHHVSTACRKVEVKPKFIFVVGKYDSEVREFLRRRNLPMRLVDEPERKDERRWNIGRYQHMVDLRNVLLEEVRSREPDLFLSLDSDILLHDLAIKSLLDGFERFPDAAAIGTKCFLSPSGVAHPNMGLWITPKSGRRSRFYRKNMNTLGRVDILMAAKCMTPAGYSIDYQPHSLGEDLGWSAAVTDSGGSLYYDGRVTNKHVMRKDKLDQVDPRVGF